MTRGRAATRAQIVFRQSEVLRLRISEHLTFRQIADSLDISAQQAHRDFTAALRDHVPAEEVAEARKAELLKLDRYEQEMERILRTNQPLVSSGKVVTDADGNPVVDAGPKVAAIGRLLSIAQQRSRLMGLNTPTQSAALTPETLRAALAEHARELGVDLEVAREAARRSLRVVDGSA
ncbi:MAG TPA: hypothetical protein VKA15_23600 [Isosphaeraceae bacterium]|nr:hypothetical protein [Isosphaeraceae bacterium]